MRISKSVLKAITLSSVLVLGGTYAFAAEHTDPAPHEATTPLQGNLDLSENGGYDPNPPSDLNKKTEINNSYFGISYVPETFDFGTTKLQDSVKEQSITTTNKNGKTFNIGVKDKRRLDTHTWSVNVKHSVRVDNGYQGVELKVPLVGDVKRNMNDGETPFGEEDLIEQVQKNNQDEVNKAENDYLMVTTEDKTLMYVNNGQFINGVYDLELGDVSLQIPDPSRVPEKTLGGNVNWTLANTPMKQHYLTEEIRNLFKDGNCKELKTEISSTQIKAAKESIDNIKDEQQKKYNQDYFNKYVDKQYVEWVATGQKCYGKDLSVASVKIIKNANNTRAGLFFEDSEGIGPHSYWGGRDYFVLTLKRDNQLLLNEHLKGDSKTRSKKSVELKPGDILEIYHAEGKNQRLKAYPEKYKVGSYSGSAMTLTFKIDSNFELETTN